RDGVIQRLKGWGKDPLVATWSAFEFVGPCRFGAIADEGNEWGVPAGQPLGVQHPAAWVQIAAVSQDQTRNTMTLFPSILSK
ncbi:terminase, partial [Streptomyces sp. A73]|nr:terminase [Streptomyces sp. A73]